MAATYGRTLGNIGVNGSSSGALTVTNNASVNEKIVGMVCCLQDTTLTVTDSGSNSYTATKVRDAAGITIWYFWADVATALTSGVSTITFTFGATVDWGCCAADVLTGTASGAPANSQSNTGQLDDWATTATATTDGSILYGGSGYRNGTASTSTVINGTERQDFRVGNNQITCVSREIATGSTHNVSGTWSDAGGVTSAAAHMVFAQGSAIPIPRLRTIRSGVPS